MSIVHRTRVWYWRGWDRFSTLLATALTMKHRPNFAEQFWPNFPLIPQWSCLQTTKLSPGRVAGTPLKHINNTQQSHERAISEHTRVLGRVSRANTKVTNTCMSWCYRGGRFTDEGQHWQGYDGSPPVASTTRDRWRHWDEKECEICPVLLYIHWFSPNEAEASHN